jgi:hypothetical protein
MSAKRERSGLEKRPAVTSPGPLLSADASLAMVLADLEGLELGALHRQWRNHLGGEAPAHMPRWLLVKVLGHRLQVAAFGDLDKSVCRLLRDESDEDGNRNTAPFDRRDAQTRDGIALRPGALLVREWRGKLERVMVLEGGYAWNGKNFSSLSRIAKAMTGTSWNGHRFFGLGQTKGTQTRARPLKGKRHGGVGGSPRSDEEASASAAPAPAGAGGAEHCNGALVSPGETPS